MVQKNARKRVVPARSQVWRSRDEVIDVSEQWCAAMRDNGWS
jgi:hypothetical protein